MQSQPDESIKKIETPITLDEIKAKTDYIAEISFNKIKEFASVLKLIDALTAKEPIICFTKEGIFAYLYTGSFYYELRVNKNFFLTYKIEKEFDISIKRKVLSDIFKKVPLENCEVIWRVTKNIDLLKVTVKERILKKYDLRLLETEKEKPQDTDKLGRFKDAKITINTADFIDMLTSVYFAENKVLLKCSEFNFDVKDFEITMGSSLMRFMKSDKLQIECKKREIIEGYYNRKLLMETLEIIKDLTEKIILNYSKNSPMSIYFKYNFVELKYYLAPMVENTD